MITETDIQNAVSKLNLSSLPVCLHASFKSIGGVEGGPEAVVRAFLAEQCTVMVSAFSDDFGVNPPLIFDPSATAGTTMKYLKKEWAKEEFILPTQTK